MRFLLRLFAFALVAVAVIWLVQDWRHRQGGSAAGPVRSAGDRRAQIDPRLDLASIQEELSRTGRIVRRKTVLAARAVAEATQDVRTTAAIKARLALDPQLSALDIGVHTTDGRVTLTGWVDSPEGLARLVGLVLEHDEVEEVISTVRVSPPSAEPVAAAG